MWVGSRRNFLNFFKVGFQARYAIVEEITERDEEASEGKGEDREGECKIGHSELFSDFFVSRVAAFFPPTEPMGVGFQLR